MSLFESRELGTCGIFSFFTDEMYDIFGIFYQVSLTVGRLFNIGLAD